MIKKILLACLALMTSACAIFTFDVRNSASSNSAILGFEPVSYQLNVVSFYKDWIPKWEKEYSQIVNEVLERHHVPFKQVFSIEKAERQHLEITVRAARHEASGQELLTGLTLWVIPSRTTRDAQWEYEIVVYEDKRPKTTTHVVVDEKTYSGLIFTPFFWISFFQFPKIKNSFESAIESLFQPSRS